MWHSSSQIKSLSVYIHSLLQHYECSSIVSLLLSLIHRRVGILVFGSNAGSAIANTVSSLSSNKIAHEVFSGREANLRYPNQLKIPDTYRCVHEDGGGILYAQKAVMTFQVLNLYFIYSII